MLIGSHCLWGVREPLVLRSWKATREPRLDHVRRFRWSAARVCVSKVYRKMTCARLSEYAFGVRLPILKENEQIQSC
jgi:hypothetical protein